MTTGDHIQTPRRIVFDWHGSPGKEFKPGDYMRAVPSNRTWLVLSVRPVKVRVTRGETSRHRVEMLPWPDEIPDGAMVYRFHWMKRQRRQARRLKP